MKQLTVILICLLLFLTVCYPAGVLICNTLGFDLTVHCLPAFAFVLAILSAYLVYLCSKRAIKSRILQIILSATLPLSLVNSLYCLGGSTALWLGLYVVACSILTIKYVKILAPRIIAFVLSGLTILPIIFLLIIHLIFGNLVQNTVVQTIESPGGSHYAQVIDNNQGAMGGNTLVDVYEAPLVDTRFLRIQKKPTRVYSGEWGEHEYMEIYWKSVDCLIINGVEYEI